MFYIIKEFVKKNRYVILWYVLMMITLFSVSLLYRKLTQPVYYSVVIITFYSCIFGVRAFFSFSKSVKEIEKVRINLSEAGVNLPQSNDMVEEEYKKLVKKLEEQRNSYIVQEAKDKLERDMYYTMWVHQIKTPISALQLLVQDKFREIENEQSKEEEEGNQRGKDEGNNNEKINNEKKEEEQSECEKNGCEFDYKINYLKTMEQELFKIEQYAEMALQYQRMQHIGDDLAFQELPIKQLIMKAVKKYSVLFIYKNIRIVFGNLECRVLTDEKWFVFILEQILSNALKYTKAGGEISCSIDKDTLYICDTGIGILPGDLSRIFEKGFTGFNGRMFEKSTGIGLFLCKQIADKLGKTILITSEVNVGTTVMIGLGDKQLEIMD